MSRCSIGKRCGASCIQNAKYCQLELGASNSSSLSKAADMILNRIPVLQTPEQAVKFFEKFKEKLAVSGIGDFGPNDADTLIIGIEPGENPDKYYQGKAVLPDRLRRVEDASAPDSKSYEKWYDAHPLVFANDIRQAFLLQRAGADTNQRDKFMYPERELDVFTREAFASGSKPFTRKLAAIADGVGGTAYKGVNISPFGFPSERMWPFNKLPFAKDSVFKDRDTWLKYASKVKTKQIVEDIVEGKNPRKLVYFGSVKPMYKEMFGNIAKQLGEVPLKKELTWESKAGRKMKVEISYFVVKKDGKKTVFMNANHPSWTGYGAESLGQMQKFLKEVSS